MSRFCLLLFLLFLSHFLAAQKTGRNNRYALGMEIGLGTSFPNFTTDQDSWSAGLYSSGNMTVSLARRFNQRWSAEAGLGMTAYILSNRGPVDNYILDFASPHLCGGLVYNFWNRKNQENFVRLRGGLQLAYQGMIVDEFESYTVIIKGEELFYYFVQPEIGIRRYSKQKMKGSKFKIAYELAAFYNHRFNPLGTVDIYQIDQTISLIPRGSVIGASIRFLFPTGIEKIKTKQKKVPTPTTIYHPRDIGAPVD